MWGGARPYTQAELDSLRAVPDQTRSSSSLRQPAARNNTYLFPGSSSLLECTDATLFEHAHDLLPVLRHGRGLCALNLHPTSARDVRVNELLWRCAHHGEYTASFGDELLGVNVLCLVMPSELFTLLRRHSFTSFQALLLEFLGQLADDADDEGVDEVDAATWAALHTSKLRDQGHVSHDDVNVLARLCLTPWKVDIYTTYVTPAATRTALAAANQPNDTPYAPRRVRSRAPSIGIVHWKLYMDWHRYRRLWKNRLGLSSTSVSRIMVDAIISGRQYAAWACVETVIAAARRPPTTGNLLAMLPRDVIWNNLAPRVLLTECAKGITTNIN